MAVPADAGVYLSLRPVQSSLPAGSVVSGSNTGGWTLTLGASASQQTFEYDLVIQITSGTSATPAAGQLFEVFGAVRGSASAGVVGEHVSSSGAVFSLDPEGTIASVPNFVAGSLTTARPGVATTVSGGLGGVGPQSGTFFNAAGQPSFFAEFLVGSTTTTSPTPSFAGLPVSSSGVAIARASFNITGSNVGDTATLDFVGGDGANGFNGTTRWASWSDSASGVPSFSTHNFDAGLTNAVRSALSISFANVAPAFVLGDFNFDGGVDASDIDPFVLAANEGDPFEAYITSSQAAFEALYPGQTLTSTIVNQIGDINGDGGLDSSDIDPFVPFANNGGARGGVSVIPEPGSIGLLLAAVPFVVRRRR
jgi:hypothetical protein